VKLTAELARFVSPLSTAVTLTAGQPYPYLPARHLRYISSKIAKAVYQGRGRLIVCCPPRHGKSESISKFTSVWHLERWPEKIVMNCGYGKQFAQEWGRLVRNIADSNADKLSFKLANDSKKQEWWHTNKGGAMICAGVGSGITGKGADCFVAGTMIATPTGSKPIESLCTGDLVYGYDGRSIVQRHVEEKRERRSDDIWYVQTVNGRTLICTGDHRIYSGGRYIRARDLRRGSPLLALQSSGVGTGSDTLPEVLLEPRSEVDAYLRSLPTDLPKGSRGALEENTSRSDELLLRAKVLWSGLHSKASEVLRALWRSESEEERRHLLWEGVRGHGARAAKDAFQGVPSVQRGVSTEVQPAAVLQQLLRRRGSQQSNAEVREPELAGQRRPVLEAVRPDAPSGAVEGQLRVRSVSQFREGSDTSHQRRSEGQSARELDCALPDTSYDTPQVAHDSVALVERVRANNFPVYDIQVEGVHNFFAEQVLAHNCLIIDDPVKGWDEASSWLAREEVWKWYLTEARSRLHPNGSIIVVLTRWNEDDLVGRLLAQAKAKPGADQWEVVMMPAIWDAKAASQGACVLGRQIGEALWPERYPVSELYPMQADELTWESLYQQRPGTVASLGNVYPFFDMPRHVRRNVSYDPQLPFFWALDFNIDPMCTVFGQYRKDAGLRSVLTGHAVGQIRVLGELCMPETSTREVCEAFYARYRETVRGDNTEVEIYGDASGNAGHTSQTSGTDYDIIKAFLREKGVKYKMCVQPKNPHVKDRVNTVNDACFQHEGLIIHPSCKMLVRDLDNVRYKRDSSGNTTGVLDKSQKDLTHVSDAFGYFVWKKFGARQGFGEKGFLVQ
jgi:hypothetical protein